MGNQFLSITDGLCPEMSELIVQSKSRAYTVRIGSNYLSEVINSKTVVLADVAITPLLSNLTDNIIAITASENEKTLSTCEHIITEMKERNLHRGSTLVAVGGGFVQDIATLASALYMRGVSWKYVPTTLMAMMDSCIGGKSSINVGGFKNLIGNFYPPDEIFIDLTFTKSLTPNAIACGLSEAVKICYARGNDEFMRFCSLRNSAVDLDSPAGVEFVNYVLSAKKWFIENDEFDTGVRQLLNFGHTFGHALEASTNFLIPHGVAIGIGMLAALDYENVEMGEIEEMLVEEILVILDPVKGIIREGLLGFDSNIFAKAFAGDKKHTAVHFRPVLSIDGKLEVVGIERSDEAIEKATTTMRHAFAKVLTP